jgi:hypothetical protein
MTSTVESPTKRYAIPGFYTVTLSVGGPGWTETLTRTSAISACYWADVVCDCVVTVADVQTVAGTWRCARGEACFSERYDADGDGEITVLDIMKVAVEWGWTCP